MKKKKENLEDINGDFFDETDYFSSKDNYSEKGNLIKINFIMI